MVNEKRMKVIVNVSKVDWKKALKFKPRYHIFNVFSDDLRKRRKWKKEKMPKSDNCILVKNAERKNQFYSKMSKISFLLRSFKDFQSFFENLFKTDED